jgi:putative hydrolase of the HAD superfamily
VLPPGALPPRLEALLLDAGDTLIFLDATAVSHALAEQGVELAAERIAGALHGAKQSYQALLARGGRHEDGWSVLVLGMLVRAGLAEPGARALLPGLRRVHDEFYFWRRVPEGLPHALARARAGGIRLAVVSNSEGKIGAMLERVGLAEHFELIVDSHLEGVQKPDPEIFRRALGRLGVAAERALYAGDIPEVDVLGARAAGMASVLVDAFGHYAGSEWPRVGSVAELTEGLLAARAGNPD